MCSHVLESVCLLWVRDRWSRRSKHIISSSGFILSCLCFSIRQKLLSSLKLRDLFVNIMLLHQPLLSSAHTHSHTHTPGINTPIHCMMESFYWCIHAQDLPGVCRGREATGWSRRLYSHLSSWIESGWQVIHERGLEELAISTVYLFHLLQQELNDNTTKQNTCELAGLSPNNSSCLFWWVKGCGELKESIYIQWADCECEGVTEQIRHNSVCVCACVCCVWARDLLSTAHIYPPNNNSADSFTFRQSSLISCIFSISGVPAWCIHDAPRREPFWDSCSFTHQKDDSNSLAP